MITSPPSTCYLNTPTRKRQIQSSSQHLKNGGVYCDGKTKMGAINTAEIILARPSAELATDA